MQQADFLVSITHGLSYGNALLDKGHGFVGTTSTIQKICLLQEGFSDPFIVAYRGVEALRLVESRQGFVVFSAMAAEEEAQSKFGSGVSRIDVDGPLESSHRGFGVLILLRHPAGFHGCGSLLSSCWSAVFQFGEQGYGPRIVVRHDRMQGAQPSFILTRKTNILGDCQSAQHRLPRAVPIIHLVVGPRQAGVSEGEIPVRRDCPFKSFSSCFVSHGVQRG